MHIKILGTRGEIKVSAPYHCKHSGVLIDDTLLLDCGEERFLQTNPHAILITHLHPDHAFFVRSEEDYQKIDCPIYAPEKYRDEPITMTEKSFTIGAYHITPIPTIHSVKVKSNAYLIEHQGKRILYTGDMIWIEKQYHYLLHDLDLVITEASSIKAGGLIRRHKKTGQIFGHQGISELMALFKQFTSTILFVHFGTWFYEDIKCSREIFKELARENGIEVAVGYDGMEIEV